MADSATHRAIDAVWRIESARLIAGLTRIVRDVSVAEDLAQDALVAALQQWPRSGVPDNPGAWLMTTAKRRGVDSLRRTVALEREMTAMWPQIDAYKALTHRVRRRQLGLQSKIDALTERATTMSVDLMRLQTALEQLDPKLTSGSKRLYAELVLQAGIYERLEMLEDPIDFASEHFELANTRLIEARNALTGFYLEALIVVVLAAEFFALVYAKL